MTDLKTINDSETELKVSVVISTDEYNKQFDNELSLIAKTATIDGFRPIDNIVFNDFVIQKSNWIVMHFQ